MTPPASAGLVHGDVDSTTTADSITNGNSSRRLKEIILPAYAATWSAASGRAKGAEVAKAAAAAMVTTPSAMSLTYTTLEEVVEEEEEPTSICWGLVKCTERRKRTCVYLGCLASMILSIELGLYIWALVSSNTP